MKTLKIEQMENQQGGMSCGWAIGIAAFSGVAMVGAKSGAKRSPIPF